MLTDGVDIYLSILLIQFNVVLHVIHKSYGGEEKVCEQKPKRFAPVTLKAL